MSMPITKEQERLKDRKYPLPYFRSQTLPRIGNAFMSFRNPYWIPTMQRTNPPNTSSQTSSEYESNKIKGDVRNSEIGPIRVNYNQNGGYNHYETSFNNNTFPSHSLNFQKRHISQIPYNISRIPASFYNQTPADKFLVKSYLFDIKDTPKCLKKGNEWDSLSEQIWNKFMVSQQTENTFRNKMSLWKNLYIKLKSVFPQYSLYLVGSTVTGLGSNGSDMDLCLVVGSQDTVTDRSLALHHLNNVQGFIRSLDEFTSIELIHAKVPILKFRDRTYNLEVDLNCNNIVGIRNTYLIYNYVQLDWRVRPLVVIIKLWAQHYNINDPKNKTISSYSLVLMVIHYLQHGTCPPILPSLQDEYPLLFRSDQDIHKIDIFGDTHTHCSGNYQSLGELFLGFLQYYSQFKFYTNTISVRLGKVIPVETSKMNNPKQLHEWKFMCIEEPYDLSNTARSVYDYVVYSKILLVFNESATRLQRERTLAAVLPSK